MAKRIYSTVTERVTLAYRFANAALSCGHRRMYESARFPGVGTKVICRECSAKARETGGAA